MIVPVIFIMVRNKEYLFLSIIGVFFTLSLTRAGLVSILSYFAMVPLSSLYLISGFYSYFIGCTVIFIFGMYYIIYYKSICRKT